MRTPRALLAVSIPLFLAITFSQAWSSTSETWEANDKAAAAASKAAHFDEAEKALLANEKLAETFPPKDARLPRTIFDLAQVYRAEGKYSDALPLYEQALQIDAKLYGPESQEVAAVLDGEAELFRSLNDYARAEPLLLKSLELRQKLRPAEDGDIAESENDLGEVYTATGEFEKAEPLLLQAPAIRRKTGETPELGQSLEAAGTLYGNTGRPVPAEQSFREAVSILGKTVGGERPDYANALESLALFCQSRHDYATAEPLLARVLEIRKTVFGPEHRDVATSLDTIAALKRAENKPQEAAALYEQALAL